MAKAQDAKLLQIHISETDRCKDARLYDAIVDKCREMRIAGVTVFRGLEGYGETAEMHRHHLLRHNQPIVMVVVDTAAKIAELVAALEGMLDTGMMAVTDVAAVRVNRNLPDIA